MQRNAIFKIVLAVYRIQKQNKSLGTHAFVIKSDVMKTWHT